LTWAVSDELRHGC